MLSSNLIQCLILSYIVIVRKTDSSHIRNYSRNHEITHHANSHHHHNTTSSLHLKKHTLPPKHHATETDEYLVKRLELINEESAMRLGGRIILNFTDAEKSVHTKIMKLRQRELDAGLLNSSINAPGLHFFEARPLIEQSPIFHIIQKMPKGALLHGHNTAMVSSEWVLRNLTYREGLMMCLTNRSLLFTFKLSDPRCINEMVLVATKRAASGNIKEFDESLRQSFDLFSEKRDDQYADVDTVWQRFNKIFAAIGDIMRFEPIFRDYHRRLLEELYEDNVMYAEIRSSFNGVYDAQNNSISEVRAIRILEQIVNDFVREKNGSFFGAKFIYAVGRRTTREDMQVKINIFKELYQEMPNFVIGFDMVGQEDKGEPLIKFRKELEQLPEGAKFFFHAGETNWFGTTTDLNILDAILHNTIRIGHAFSLDKHPALMKLVKEKDIGVELLPISNQVLGLVHDLRNHPGAIYISENLPIVISSDDPGYWGAKGLSYDFYYALMAFAPYDAGLDVLKQLVINSIKYSYLKDDERVRFNKMFEHQWSLFINNIP